LLVDVSCYNYYVMCSSGVENDICHAYKVAWS
jgi:hypothetical protein